MWDALFTNCIDHDPNAGDKPALPGAGGVYLLTDEQDRLIQLASAADVKRAVLNRLAGPQSQAPTPGATDSSPAPAEDTAEVSPADASAADAPGDVAGTGIPSRSHLPGESLPAGPSSTPEATEPATHPAETSSPAAAPSTASRRRADLSTIVRRIRWQPAHSAFEIAYEYLRISRQVMPSAYLKSLAFGPAWFIHVDPAAEVPRFAVAKLLPGGKGITLGPFSTQQDANRFVQAIEDVFDLCRDIRILEQAPHGQPCAYHEMGRCPAPCGGLVPMSRYRESVEQALNFATGGREAIRREWEAQMRTAAGELAFERAAAVKQRIERARELDHAAFRFVGPIERFSWLIVQRGAGRTRVRPFFVKRGAIAPGEPAKLKELEQVVPAWLAHFQSNDPPAPSDDSELQQVSEHIWLVSHFLYRREQTGLFLEAKQLPDADRVIRMIRDAFTPATREPDPQAASDIDGGDDAAEASRQGDRGCG